MNVHVIEYAGCSVGLTFEFCVATWWNVDQLTSSSKLWRHYTVSGGDIITVNISAVDECE